MKKRAIILMNIGLFVLGLILGAPLILVKFKVAAIICWTTVCFCKAALEISEEKKRETTKTVVEDLMEQYR